MFGLGAEGAPNEERKKHYMELGNEITHTCRQSYKNSGNLQFRFKLLMTKYLNDTFSIL